MKATICTAFALAIIMLVSEVSCGPSTEAPASQPLKSKDPICFEMLGCITTSEEWYSIKRPINLNPSSREEIGTTFKLYTRKNDLNAERLRVTDNGNVESRFFDPNKDTKFIIHGFTSSSDEQWVLDMTQLLLKHLDVNVLTVDWSKGASATYPQAVSNTRVVGLEVANMVNALIDRKGASASRIHLIGHSLGAHTAGYAGERIAGLKRITGLDPAGPLFKEQPSFVRLDPSDAEFVDVIHTDAEALGYGIQDISGHIDFFPNGGFRQPGAEVPGIPRSTIPEEIAQDHDLGSSHGRSIQLFLDSIRALPVHSDDRRSRSQVVNDCPFIGFPCESYEAFLEGNCTDCGENRVKCPPIGINADSYYPAERSSAKPQKFYLKTNSMQPFCGHHYALKMTLANNTAGRDETAGQLTATLTGDRGTIKDMVLTEGGSRMLKKGKTYTFLGFNQTNVGNIKEALVTWKWIPQLLTKVACLLGCDKDLNLSNLQVTNLGNSPYKGTAQCTRLLEAAFLGILNIPTVFLLPPEPMFSLYTRQNTEREVLEVAPDGKVYSKYYDSKKNTKFITHGFLGSGTNEWVQDLKNALLDWGDINVIVVDWQKLATVRYPKAATNTEVVGKEIARLIKALINDFGGNLDNFHLIGHSLGSHVSGYAGKQLNGLNRISALDPAGPLFSEAPIEKRLDFTDAKFVDAIHTDKECLGTRVPRGHVSFYPNGGSQQPGCGIASMGLRLENNIGGTLANADSSFCSHFRACKFYIESIRLSTPKAQRKHGHPVNGSCQFKGILSDSYSDYLKGTYDTSVHENARTAIMGIDADTYSLDYTPNMVGRKFFLRTNAWEPYCSEN